MNFLDKVKEQAAVATAVAKDAAQKGQARLDDFQAKRVADALLRDLGAATYAQLSGRATDATPGDVDRVTAALRAHEVEHGPISLAMESQAAGGGAGSPYPPGSSTEGSEAGE